MSDNGSELQVITKAKDLAEYVIIITHKSPKEFRFTFVSKMQNLALDAIDKLYRANDVYVTKENKSNYPTRYNYMKAAVTDIRLLIYISEIAMKCNCILPKQYHQISLKGTETLRYIGAWINGDRRRLGMKD